MTNAQQTQTTATFTKAQRESIFRTYMNMCTRQGIRGADAIYYLAEDHGVECETIMACLNRTVVGR